MNKLLHAVAGIKTIIDTKLMHIQALELVKRIWKHVVFLDDSILGDLLRNPSRLLFTAAALGNVEFIIVLIRMYPSLIWKVNEKSRSIFHTAVIHRQGKIFNLIHEIGAHKDLIAAYKDEENNNMLHLAAKLAPPNRLKTDSGAALQLRRELHWFKVDFSKFLLNLVFLYVDLKYRLFFLRSFDIFVKSKELPIYRK